MVGQNDKREITLPNSVNAFKTIDLQCDAVLESDWFGNVSTSEILDLAGDNQLQFFVDVVQFLVITGLREACCEEWYFVDHALI